MSVLVLSRDDDAAGALCAALSRAGHRADRAIDLGGTREICERNPPLVMVVDTAVAGYAEMVEETRRARPWTRFYLMVDASEEPARIQACVVPKPFDAAELAVLLEREQELAESDRGRRNLERELEHAERLAAIGRLAASMAHEINNPLAVILASATFVAEAAEASRNSELAECARDLEVAADRISGFVKHVCGYARRERPQLIDAPLRVPIEMALRMLRPRAKERKVEVIVEPLPPLRALHDPPRLSQAVLNVLSNAVDAAASKKGQVRLGMRDEQGEILIWIEDDGPGVDAAIADKVFEPFATSKPHGQGTGLGLAITRQILDDHGGSVSLRTRPEGGARAELRVPTLNTAAHRVLVIEAESGVRRALATELRREGFAVVTAGTLGEAMHELDAQSITVVVCDPALPDVGSAELLGALRSASPNSGILVVTDDDLESFDADCVLPKPWERSVLVAGVRELCVG